MSSVMQQEELLDAWLKLSSSIISDRLVKSFSFNESFVLNLLYKNYISNAEAKLTAKDLCMKTNILKSQMNAILNSLEEKGMILRSRSKVDKRLVEIEINPQNVELYERSHADILRLCEGAMRDLDDGQISMMISGLNMLTNGFAKMMEERNGN